MAQINKNDTKDLADSIAIKIIQDNENSETIWVNTEK